MGITVPITDAQQSEGVNNITFSKPGALQDNDIIYVIACKDDDAGGSWTNAQSFTKLNENITSAGEDLSSSFWRKIISDASSEPGSYVFSTTDNDNYTGVLVVVRGADVSGTPEEDSQEATGINDLTPDSPSVTSTSADALILCACVLTEQAASITFVAPSGMNLDDSIWTTESGTDIGCAIASVIQAGAGVSGVKTWQNTSGGAPSPEWHTYSVAITEAAAAPTTLAPTTLAPTTIAPTTIKPTTIQPTTPVPTTLTPTTVAPTTIAPTTPAPTTLKPTTLVPTTVKPTTIAPTTIVPTTVKPTTIAPTTPVPTTLQPTTPVPTTLVPTTLLPTTLAPTTPGEFTTSLPTTILPTTLAPTTSFTPVLRRRGINDFGFSFRDRWR